MSTWPTAIDYRDALQHPERSFRDPALQRCRAETNKMGVPRARAGAFANVYRLDNGTDARAVRVFLYPQPEREERYQAVSDHLRQRGRPPGLIDFRYEAQGIRVGADWFPILIMDWVKGESLGEWARAAVQRQERRRLAQMAERWLRLVGGLRAAHIAHGDLQHDNVLVVDDVPLLVDYDCMCVPALVGRKALEAGKPAYQHPRRVEQELSLDLDHFSAWVIRIALRALAADLALWAKYVERSGNENLLFTEDDLKEPAVSPLWADLLASPDTEVRGWAHALRDTLPDRPLTLVPPFGIDQDPARRQAVAAQADRGRADEPSVAASATQLPQHKHRLGSHGPQAKQRVQARDEIERAAEYQRTSGRAAPASPGNPEAAGGDPSSAAARPSQAEKTRARDAILGQLWGPAIEEGEEADRHVVGLWDEDLLAGCPDAEFFRPSYEAARSRLQRVDAVRRAVERAEQGQGREQDIVQAAVGLPDGYVYSFSARVQRARHHVSVSEELDRLVHADPVSDVALAEAFDRALAGGSLRLAKTVVTRCRLAVRRRNCLRRLQAIDASLSLDRQDALWVQCWDDALLEGCLDARPYRTRYRQAAARSAAWKELEDVLRHRDLARVRTAAANPLLADYPPRADRAEEIEELLRQAKQAERVRELLRQRRAAEFTAADLQFIRDNEAMFRPCRGELEDVLGEWLNGPLGLRPGSPAYAADGRSGGVTAKWVWPHECVRYCQVVVDPDSFFETPEEAAEGTTRVFAESYRRAGGLPLPLLPRWRRAYLTVWPVIDLGWLQLRGQPLKLGPVPLLGVRQ
jgi:hypothetical protein